jgi:hypothetical protein
MTASNVIGTAWTMCALLIVSSRQVGLPAPSVLVEGSARQLLRNLMRKSFAGENDNRSRP